MVKIRRPPPRGILDHLLDRYRKGRITVEEFTELKHWLESDPDVEEGEWFKRFGRFTLAGEGELPKTFLEPHMIPYGKEVF